MSAAVRLFERLALRLLTRADTLANSLYGQRFNPLYQSGTIVVALYLVLLVTGLWLLLFYRVGSPWESVASITASRWTGNWVRGLHRYASDLAVVATVVHAVRMFAQGRSWGPRALAWTSGCVLLFLVLLCGWTGYVMVWDTFGQHLAREGARMLDALPVLSEPTSRAFTGEQPLPTAFFFLALFAHIGIPLGMAVLFWIHVKRVARPAMMPPRAVTWGVTGVLTLAAVLLPIGMAPQADALLVPNEVPVDLFFAFWLPLSSRLSGGSALLLTIAIAAALLVVPALTVYRRAARPPSVVDEEICVGCVQCSLDCPYGAITMIPRDSRRSPIVARVDPTLCVSCGICAGSCPPMGVGPPGRTGRDQLARVRSVTTALAPGPGGIVAIYCEHAAASFANDLAAAGAAPYPVGCAGSLHTSVIESMLRTGTGGVIILACPPRDCWHREGARWLTERVYHSREAELQARVDRARVKTVHVSAGDRRAAVEAVRDFAAAVRALGSDVPPDSGEVGTECDAVGAGRTS